MTEFYNLSIKGRIPNIRTKDQTIDRILWQLEDIGCKDLSVMVDDGAESVVA
jgi:hypothetical protein